MPMLEPDEVSLGQPFPFSIDEEYLSDSEKKHLKIFDVARPEIKHRYKAKFTKKGEWDRTVMAIRWPEGTINRDTIWAAKPPKRRRPVNYHTPCAKLPIDPDGENLARVEYVDYKSGKVEACTSKEWLDWIVKNEVADLGLDQNPPEKTQAEQERVKDAIATYKRSMKAEEAEAKETDKGDTGGGSKRK